MLKKDKELVFFPILSFTAVILLLFILLNFYFLFGGNYIGSSPFKPLNIFTVLFYELTYFIVVFFNTGLITCVYKRLNGEPCAFKDGLVNAIKHIPAILIWVLISSTVGLLLNAISNKSNILGRIVSSMIGFAWSLATFFVVPVLVLQHKSPLQALKESGAIFKRTWGEEIVGGTSMGLFFVLLTILAALPSFLGIFLAIYLGYSAVFIGGLIVTIASWIIIVILFASLNTIFVTALYIYGITGKISSIYDSDLIKNAFKKKGHSKTNVQM